MNMIHPTYLTLVIATHKDSDDPCAPTSIIGFGKLEVCKRGMNDWSFVVNAAVADTLGDEGDVITQLADILPMPKFIIGEAINARILAPLDAAAERADPAIAAHVRHRVARMQTALPVDVSIGTARGPATLPYAELNMLCSPVIVAVNDYEIIDPKRVRAQREARVVNDWLRFLTASGSQHTGIATIATITWMAATESKA
jgi:hypothetical protein